MNASSISMAQQNGSAEKTSSERPFISRIASKVLWSLFILSLVLLGYYLMESPDWNSSNMFRINGFTLLIWSTVLFFSAILSSYSKNYLTGFKYQQRFTWLSLGFASSVMLMVASNHLALLLIGWFGMSIFMSGLIGVDKDWAEAKAAGMYSLRFFISGGILLSIGLLLLGYQIDNYTLNGIIQQVDTFLIIYN